jgi:tRNA/tmRNA/rRNA uracil-C5-methylase (TrmA/RlmC/RlmD family)
LRSLLASPSSQHFGPCGGCTLQSLQYEAQLAAKQRQVAELLRRTAGVADVEAVMRPIVGCPPGQQYAYRNKMEFSFCGPEAALEGGGAEGREARGHKHTRNRSSGRSSAGARRAAAEAAAAAGWSPGGGAGTASSSSSSSSSSGGDGGLLLGLKRPGFNAAVLPITQCHLQSDAANELLQLVLRLCRQHGLQPYDSATRSGLLQHVVIRRGSTARERGAAATSGSISSSSGSRGGTDDGKPGSTGSAGCTASSSSGTEEYLVNIVTAADGRKALAPLAAALTQQAAQLSSTQSLQQPGAPSTSLPAGFVVAGVVNSVLEPGRPTGERRLAAEHVLAGRGFLYEQLLGLEFEVSANSFFQTNSRQAEALYSLVAAGAELRGTDVLLDLYCGTGSIGLCLAGACKQVRGVEISASAVADAERNAARNGITNAAFLQVRSERAEGDNMLRSGTGGTACGCTNQDQPWWGVPTWYR